MKKLLILLVASALFFACSPDKPVEKPQKDHLIGKWYLSLEKGHYFFNEKRYDYEDPYTKENTWLHFEFSADGTMVSTDLDFPEEPHVFTVTWSVNGNILTFDAEFEDKEVFTIESLTSTTMSISQKGQDEDGPYEDTLTFIKMS